MSITFRRQIEQWSRIHAILLLVTTLAAVYLRLSWPLAAVGLVSFMYYIWQGRKVQAGKGEGSSGLSFDQLLQPV